MNQKVFIPANDRLHPFLIELDVTLPAKSVCKISYEFDEAFLRLSVLRKTALSSFLLTAFLISVDE